MKSFISQAMKTIETWNERSTKYLVRHVFISLSITGLGIFVAELGALHLNLALVLLAVGALSYWFGLLPSSVISLIWVLCILFLNVAGHVSSEAVIIHVVGLADVVFLGASHKLEVNTLKSVQQRLHRDGGRDRVLPWAVANDIRSSLAAVRFLLFPIQEESNKRELEIAAKELSRIEEIISQTNGNVEQHRK